MGMGIIPSIVKSDKTRILTSEIDHYEKPNHRSSNVSVIILSLCKHYHALGKDNQDEGPLDVESIQCLDKHEKQSDNN